MQTSKTLTLPLIDCPDHPEETIFHVNMSSDEKLLLCGSCFLSGKFSKDNVSSIPKMLSLLSKFDEEARKISQNAMEILPAEILKAIENQDNNISEVQSVIETAKENISTLVESEIEKVISQYEKLKISIFEELDDNLARI